MKMFIDRVFVLGFLMMAAALFLIPEALAFRCGSGLVNVGDTKSRVLIECGAPAHKEKVGVKDVYRGTTGTKGKRGKSSRQVEQWTYNCGDGDFIYILTFEGGKLVKEETNGRGKGKSQCEGK